MLETKLERYWNKVIVACHLTGDTLGSVFTDEKQHTITKIGSPYTVEGKSPFANSSSAYFNGSSALSMADSRYNTLLSSDWTIDFWLAPTNASTTTSGLNAICGNRTANYGFILDTRFALGKLDMIYIHGYNGSNININTSINPSDPVLAPAGGWNFVEITKVGADIYFFLNGAFKNKVALPGTWQEEGAGVFQIGRSGSSYYTGYVSDFRVTKTPRHIVDYSPPTIPFPNTYTNYLPDTMWNDVAISVPLEGAVGSNTFVDIKGNTTASQNNVICTITNSPFGTTAAYFDGNGDCIKVSQSAEMEFVAGDWTAEAFVQCSGYLNQYSKQTIFSRGESGYANYFLFGIVASDNPPTRLMIASGGSTIYFTVPNMTNRLMHVALVRANGMYTIYMDGVSIGTASIGNPQTSLYPFVIGGDNNNQETFYGVINGVRVTKSARYTANFTPEYRPFPVGGTLVAGVVKDDTDTPTSRTVRVYDRVTGALVGSTISDPTTGNYVINPATSNQCYVIVLDDDAGTQYNALIADKVTPFVYP